MLIFYKDFKKQNTLKIIKYLLKLKNIKVEVNLNNKYLENFLVLSYITFVVSLKTENGGASI